MKHLPVKISWTPKKLMSHILKDYVHKTLNKGAPLYSVNEFQLVFDSMTDGERYEVNRVIRLQDLLGEVYGKVIYASTLAVRNINTIEIVLRDFEIYPETEKGREALKLAEKDFRPIFITPYYETFTSIVLLNRINLFFDFLAKLFKGSDLDKLKCDMLDIEAAHQMNLAKIQILIKKLKDNQPSDLDGVLKTLNLMKFEKPLPNWKDGTEDYLKKLLKRNPIDRQRILDCVFKQIYEE